MVGIPFFLKPKWWHFEWRYWRSRTPWDTQITPPEVLSFLADADPGRALDLGCGTGTNAITLAEHGWQVSAIDFSLQAIREAQRKARRAGHTIDFQLGDVADLDRFCGPYDYALDIGCLFALPAADRLSYAQGLKRLLRPGACYMLYAWLPRIHHGKRWGMSPQEVSDLFAPQLEITRTVVGEESGHGSAWYWLHKKS